MSCSSKGSSPSIIKSSTAAMESVCATEKSVEVNVIVRGSVLPSAHVNPSGKVMVTVTSNAGATPKTSVNEVLPSSAYCHAAGSPSVPIR